MLWHSWGRIEVSKKVTLEIPVGFTPVPNLQNSRILGTGWAFPIFESTFLAVNEREYEMRFPTGHRALLKKTKTPGRLENSGWKAVVAGTTITAQSSCGWMLVFDSGRLKSFKTPDGALVEFRHDSRGTQTMSVNGKTALTLQSEFDRTTTRRIARLTLQDGRRALLRFGTRPALVETLEKGPPQRKVQRVERVETLASIQWGDQKEEHYTFGQDSLTLPESARINSNLPSLYRPSIHSYKWNPATAELLSDGFHNFSIVKIRGLKCLQMTNRGGGTEMRSLSHNSVSISKLADGPITITEWMPSHITDADQMPIARKIFHYKDGKETLVLQRWVDAENRDRKLFLVKDGKKLIYEFSPSEIVQKDAGSGKILLRKTYDAQKRILTYQNETTSYRFSYPSDPHSKTATLTRITSSGESTRQLPLEALKKITERL